jgi:hypothetical protein
VARGSENCVVGSRLPA